MIKTLKCNVSAFVCLFEVLPHLSWGLSWITNQWSPIVVEVASQNCPHFSENCPHFSENCPHFTLFQAQGEVVLHINIERIFQDYLFKIMENGLNFSMIQMCRIIPVASSDMGHHS